MPDPVTTLSARFAAALGAAFGEEFAGTDPVIRPSAQPQFGDYQANVAMALGKKLGRPPREVAEALVAAVDLDGVCDHVEVAGPGFINLTLADDFLAREVATMADDERLGVGAATSPEKVVIDYSSPNVAREMHVGHIRSTVIGDALARVLSFLGHDVVRHNHLGDWGTQFGLLIESLVDQGWERSDDHHIGDLNVLYQEANERFASEPGFADRARSRVVALQAGDPATLALWRDLVEESKRHMDQVYDRLGVTLTEADICPESFYNPLLDDVASELEQRGLARVDDGALCAFPEGFKRRDGGPLPLIIRKSDGGYGYQATDLAAVRFRARELGGARLVYAVDARQSQHLAMVFAVAEAAGWLAPGHARAEHVAFGTILRSDGKPFSTRAGESVKLIDLLDEAETRAAAAVAERNPDLDEGTRASVARAVGIGAIKYADLSNDRVKDYVFDFDRMLSFDGNTAPYLQYAHARIQSIFRRVEQDDAPGGSGGIVLGHAAERALALQLLAFESTIVSVADFLQPHRLCTYLFELASSFTTFYEHCPVLRAESEAERSSRLALCSATARTLELGLDLLGIGAPERM